MSTIEQLRNDINAIMALAGEKSAEYSRRQTALASSISHGKTELGTVRKRRAAASAPPFAGSSPLVRSVWGYIRKNAISELSGKASEMEGKMRGMAAEGRGLEKSRRTMDAVSVRLGKTTKHLDLLDHPPADVADRLFSISGAVTKNGRKKDAKAIVDTARDIVVCVDAWARASIIARERLRADGEGKRIWLPIPSSMSSQAKALGAKLDPSVKGEGASPFYVEVGDPLAKFNSLLPHAFRETRPKLKFASIRQGAARQNLWSFFDKLSWDHIRNVNYSATGRRCILCGKQGGSLQKRLEPEKKNKAASVECHEVWNWSRPDPDIPVGIQSLERIMTLCFDCHMSFHDDVAHGKAMRAGDEQFARQVQGYLIKRRAFLTHADPQAVALEMKEETALLDAHRGVTTWIVDLTKLAKQDYMYGQTPTLIEDNPAGVKPSQIAGITFRDGDGTVHKAVTPERLYQDTAMRFVTQPEPGYRVVGR